MGLYRRLYVALLRMWAVDDSTSTVSGDAEVLFWRLSATAFQVERKTLMGKASRGKWVRRAIRFRSFSNHPLDRGVMDRLFRRRRVTWQRALAFVGAWRPRDPVVVTASAGRPAWMGRRR